MIDILRLGGLTGDEATAVIVKSGKLIVAGLTHAKFILEMSTGQYMTLEEVDDSPEERRRILAKWDRDKYARVRLSHLGEDAFTEDE